ncbi:Extracellular serine-rich protein [Lachnellula suecica]|uniref:Extracellular serine-rich protein n=1 Tax=Lachnellula suecica TaxID=602035 RepID=A0A8T9C5T7_9HELO|nr:Extracellular serine-rich protein [Lachnellula suecica]
MLFNVVPVVLVACVSSAFAQNVAPSSTRKASSSTSTSATSATQTIQVGVTIGKSDFNFNPHTLNASIGDIIEFSFFPQNHSVVRAAFGTPCVPIENTGAGPGFWSGFQPVASIGPNPPTYQIHINDTEPIFIYCSAPNACVNGMVGVINPNSTFTYDAQLAFAGNTSIELSPGESPSEGVAPTRSSGATQSTTTAESTSAAPAAGHKSSLPTGAIVGIAIGGFAVVVLAIALIYMCGRQKTVQELIRHSQPPPRPTTYQPGSPGMSEAQYSNMNKSPIGHEQHYSAQSYGPTDQESYRSMSPPLANEHTHMMGMNPNQFQHGYSPGAPPMPGSPPYPSPVYSQEMDTKPYNPQEHHPAYLDPNAAPKDSGPHEMAVPDAPSRNVSTMVGPPTPQDLQNRPFSYTETPIEKSGTLR